VLSQEVLHVLLALRKVDDSVKVNYLMKVDDWTTCYLRGQLMSEQITGHAAA